MLKRTHHKLIMWSPHNLVCVKQWSFLLNLRVQLQEHLKKINILYVPNEELKEYFIKQSANTLPFTCNLAQNTIYLFGIVQANMTIVTMWQSVTF